MAETKDIRASMERNKLPQWLMKASFCALMVALTAVSANAAVPALFVFGDSSVDCGTNNYINTTDNFRGDFPPYGQDYFEKPTGRYSNGRIIIDFIAEYTGESLIPPYLEPNADLSHGANFASGGSGVLVTTSAGLVIDFPKQLSQFLQQKAAVTQQHGQAFAEEFFSNAVYIMSIGSNDYLGGYFGSDPKQRENYTPEQFVDTIVTGIVEGIKVLYTAGARKVVLFGLGPLGCLPALRARNENGSCSVPVSAIAATHNDAMKGALSQLDQFLPRLTLVQAHFYEFFTKILENPSKYGFVSADEPCCGARPCEGRCAAPENEPRKAGCELCPNANAYVWWDPYHPSEAVHKQFAEIVWNGSALGYVQPVGVEELFKQKAEPHCADKFDHSFGEPLQQLVSESFLLS